MALVVRDPPANGGVTEDPASIPGSGGGNGNPLQYSCLGNPTDRGAWWGCRGLQKSWTWLKWHSSSSWKPFQFLTLTFWVDERRRRKLFEKCFLVNKWLLLIMILWTIKTPLLLLGHSSYYYHEAPVESNNLLGIMRLWYSVIRYTFTEDQG